MSVAQTKAARRKFRQFYRKDTPIGTPHYGHAADAATASRREFAFRERQKRMSLNRAKMKK